MRPTDRDKGGYNASAGDGGGGRLWAAWERACAAGSDRQALATMVAATVVYVALALYLMRGVGFTIDELIYFGESSGFGPGALAEPFGGHLQALSRFQFELSLRLLGPEHLPIQIITVLTAAAAALLLFALLRRWVSGWAALPAALIVLFLGSTPVSLQGNAIMWGQSTALGLAAFAAFDRGGRRADLLGCGLLLLSVLSLEVGLAFSLGVAAWALARGEARSRLWVAVVPLLAYAAWWLWALKFDEDVTTVSNVLLIPSFSVELLGAAAASAAGLGISFSEPNLAVVDSSWAPVLLVAALGFVVAVARRRGANPLLWAVVAFLAALAVATALAYGPLRFPTSARYLFPASLGLMLLVGASVRGSHPGPRSLAVLFALALFALPGNLWLLQERGKQMRALSAETDATLAMIELQREIVSPNYRVGIRVPVAARDYLGGVDRFGSPAPSSAEIELEPPAARAAADEALGAILAPRLGQTVPSADCEIRSTAAAELLVPTGGAVLISEEGGPVRLRRFGVQPSIEAGSLPAETGRVLDLPPDDSDIPWLASVSGGEFALCELPAQG